MARSSDYVFSVLRGLPLLRFTGSAAAIAFGGLPRRRGVAGRLPANSSGEGAGALSCAEIASISLVDAANHPAANPSAYRSRAIVSAPIVVAGMSKMRVERSSGHRLTPPVLLAWIGAVGGQQGGIPYPRRPTLGKSS